MALSPHNSSSPVSRLSLEQLLSSTVQRRSSNFQTSYYPKTNLTPELERKVAFLGAFKLVVASGDFRRRESRQEPERSRTPHWRPRLKQDDFSLVALSRVLETEKKCSLCKLAVCRCTRTIYDESLEKVLVAVGNRARTASPTAYREARSFKSPATRAARPHTAGKFFLRSTLNTPTTRKRFGLFKSRRKGGEALNGVLQVTTVTPLKRAQSSRNKFPTESLMRDMSQNTGFEPS